MRFFAQSPDGRIFATGMYNKADNTQGSVFILDGWDERTHTFAHVTHYLDHLRNPNNLAFYTEPATAGRPAQTWLYLPLTDRLLRYKYTPGDTAPSSPPQVLMRFPDYGLNYKYGGWHLTRTVAIGSFNGHTRVYIAAGSSCNYCREREVIRASLSAMTPTKPPGAAGARPSQCRRSGVCRRPRRRRALRHQHGRRPSRRHAAEDTFFELQSNDHGGPIAQQPTPNYGWPTCYFAHGQPVLDTTPLPDMPALGDPQFTADKPASTNTPSGALKTAIATNSAADPTPASAQFPRR